MEQSNMLKMLRRVISFSMQTRKGRPGADKQLVYSVGWDRLRQITLSRPLSMSPTGSASWWPWQSSKLRMERDDMKKLFEDFKADKDKLIAHKDEVIALKEKLIADKEKVIADKETQLKDLKTDKEKLIAEKDIRIAEKEPKLEDLQRLCTYRWSRSYPTTEL